MVTPYAFREDLQTLKDYGKTLYSVERGWPDQKVRFAALRLTKIAAAILGCAGLTLYAISYLPMHIRYTVAICSSAIGFYIIWGKLKGVGPAEAQAQSRLQRELPTPYPSTNSYVFHLPAGVGDQETRRRNRQRDRRSEDSWTGRPVRQDFFSAHLLSNPSPLAPLHQAYGATLQGFAREMGK